MEEISEGACELAALLGVPFEDYDEHCCGYANACRCSDCVEREVSWAEGLDPRERRRAPQQPWDLAA